MPLPRRHAPLYRPRFRPCRASLLPFGVLAALFACTHEDPLPPEPPPLQTLRRFVDEAELPASGETPLLVTGKHVFLESEARPVLTAAATFTPGLLCEPCEANVPRPCRGKRPAGLPAVPHAIFTRGERRGAAPRAVLLEPGAETPVGMLTPAQIVFTRVYAVPALGERTITTEAFTVPPGALLRLSIGVEEPAWWVDSAPALFRVELEDPNGSKQDLYRRVLDPARNPADRRWFDSDVDLSDLAGRTIRLRFIAEPASAGDVRPSLPLWGDPRLLAPHGSRTRPSIVLVSLDTLRARSMSLYGHALETTPRMTALAARGTVFENAFTTFSNTLDAHMSMLTGLYPATHAGSLTPVLDPQHQLLAEGLRRAGYATAAFTEDALLDARRGFTRGFSTYHENTAIVTGSGDAPRTFGRALEWAGRHADEPFFLFVHTYQVHAPYEPPLEYQMLFTGPGSSQLSVEQRAYEQEIRYVDDVLQRLVDGLRRLLPDDQLLLVVTADHGEEFYEHGMPTHVQLFDEVMHVPLLMVWPGRIPAGRRIAEPVSLVDLTPTLLQLAGAPVPAGVEGLSLVPLLSGEAKSLGREAVLGEYPKSGAMPSRHFVARSADAKCILAEAFGEDVCYDLRADPGEKRPRPASETRAFTRLHELAAQYRTRAQEAALAAAAARKRDVTGAPPTVGATRADATTPAPDDAIERKMRALGYVE